MPVAGRPRNPEAELPLRFHAVRHVVVTHLGESPGLMEYDRRAGILAAGTIRRVWRQAVAYVAAQGGFSWSENGPDRLNRERPLALTTALRYRAQSLYVAAGTDATRWGAPRPAVEPRHRNPRPTIGAGTRKNRPTIRNRLRSFGSRVAPLNEELPASAVEQVQG